MTTIVLTNSEWDKLRPRLDADYGNTTTLISWRCRETLGFTIRRHRGFSHAASRYEEDTRLDFVNEEAATFFRMKYL